MRVGGMIIGRDEGLDDYLATIQKFPMLEATDEHQLATAWRSNGDTRSLDKIVTSHLRLVGKIARGFLGYGLPIGELIAAGNVGLVRAAQRFDAEKGFRFATYATWWIRAEIQEYVLGAWSLVRIGRNAAQKKLFFNLRRLKAQLRSVDGGALTPADVRRIAKTLEVAEREVVEMNGRLAGNDLSLNVVSGDENSDEWQDAVLDDRADPETAVGEAEELSYRRDLMRKALEHLNDRERHIIYHRKLRDDPVTLDSIACHFGISRERVRQIEARAYAKICAEIAETCETHVDAPLPAARKSARRPCRNGPPRAKSPAWMSQTPRPTAPNCMSVPCLSLPSAP